MLGAEGVWCEHKPLDMSFLGGDEDPICRPYVNDSTTLAKNNFRTVK